MAEGARARARYDPAWVAGYFDNQQQEEWDRLVRSPVDRVSLAVHTHYLERFVRPGSRVLEVGAGPGRFTQVLAGLGCQVVVVDISEGQLDAHRRRALELGFEGCVVSRRRLDMCDMGELPSASFDAVVCYGGPLSYVFERAPQALEECARVCRSGGHMLASVMSLWGSVHRFLPGVLEIPDEANRRIVETGDLTPENWSGVRHRCHMFRLAELRGLVQGAGMCLETLSSTACLSTRWEQELSGLDEASPLWQELLRIELEACASPGCLEAGTHIIVVAKKP